ncbi:lasso peptide biosynthesis B2 protein [Streptomyces sp. UNOC14_S4]|uniref:lasso peptide biosynthesis B2 protein n=1 Tax=Streptomyces sp. UNOC14_S4 TaxID=2872340 RepID=UPI001E4C93FF|nr:lasso peptide biosynthesis B2 protein [Streptomyces sp. UNOC14_S4]MCC3772043.1 lasso peptide biosynthesis B2 protein [Streptomyces sp. UNOC14_S4]
MSQILDTPAHRTPLRRRVPAHAAVTAARLIAHLAPRRIVFVLGVLRRGAVPATAAQALRARDDVTGSSTLCAGKYCLQRSLATALLCRMRGTWPTWCSGVRTPPFAAHAWVEAEGHPVGEPPGTASYRTLLRVPPEPTPAPAPDPAGAVP